MTVVSSPCTKICVLDAESQRCRGCGRTLAEIASWGLLGEDERLRIMAELPRRLAARRERAVDGDV